MTSLGVVMYNEFSAVTGCSVGSRMNSRLGLSSGQSVAFRVMCRCASSGSKVSLGICIFLKSVMGGLGSKRGG